jgi:hypothetical protein
MSHGDPTSQGTLSDAKHGAFGEPKHGALGDPKLGVLGFLTVLEHEHEGLVGGYLILNHAGRPLEFHCTAPVKPNRAQQILFGPTLQSYLYGEQIGQTLLAKGSVEPLAVCTDVELALSVRDYVSLPVALVLRPEEKPAASDSAALVQTTTWRVDAPHRAGPHLNAFEIGRNLLAVAASRDADRQAIADRLESLVNFDLSEPFQRIREAVEEAHKGGARSTG